MTIIVNTHSANKTVHFAAEELKQYLARMMEGEGEFSVSLSVQSDESSGTDAFSVQMNENGGAIIGANPRSVLLGVYDYLRYLGCRFLSYIKETEVVPVIPRSALPAQYEKKAAFPHRGVCLEGGNSGENVLDFIAWLPKAGYNSFFLQFKVPYAFLARYYQHEKNPYAQPEPFTMEDAEAWAARFEEAIQLRSLMLHKVGHGWTGEVLGDETVGSWNTTGIKIPEEKRHMAALCGGKREYFMDIPANTNICFSQPDAVEAFIRNVVHYAKQNRGVDYLHIWLADERNNICECPDCQKTTPTDQYVAFLNEVDRRLTAEGLDTRIVFLLYQELLWPPVRNRLENPDRFILMFAPISRTFEASYDLSNVPDTIPAYERNQIVLPVRLQENLAFLKGWQATFGGESFVYDYPLGRAHYGDFGYLHIARIIAQDIRQLPAMGLNGYMSCQELRVVMPNMLPNYVMGYMLFDDTQNAEALIDEYYRAAYPEKTALAKEYLETLSRLSSCDYVNGKGPRLNGEMARRMDQIVEVCEEMESRLSALELSGPFWELLVYHNGYIRRLAGAIQALAQGQNELAKERYLAAREYICKGEPRFQPCLDVYRVLEVTQKYTKLQVE